MCTVILALCTVLPTLQGIDSTPHCNESTMYSIYSMLHGTSRILHGTIQHPARICSALHSEALALWNEVLYKWGAGTWLKGDLARSLHELKVPVSNWGHTG